jgi:hypothetical protein
MLRWRRRSRKWLSKSLGATNFGLIKFNTEFQITSTGTLAHTDGSLGLGIVF